MIPYTPVRSGTCESKGLKSILEKKVCAKILNALRKIGLEIGGNTPSFESGLKYRKNVNTKHSMSLPYGCVFNDDGDDAVLWNPVLPFQKSFPCGSTWNGHKYNCFCEKQSKLSDQLD